MFKKIATTCGLLIAVSVAASCSYFRELIDPLPSDRQLEVEFESRRELFLQLAELFEANPRIRRVMKDSKKGVTFIPDLSNEEKASLETKRDEFVQLFNSVQYAERATIDGTEIVFISMDERYIGADVDGGGRSEQKGFAYSKHSISPIVDSLETGRTLGQTVFRPIEPNWYFYYRIAMSKPE